MKEWYQSKTVHFNLIMTVVMISEFAQSIHPEWISVTALIAGVGNIVLRVWFTDTEIRL